MVGRILLCSWRIVNPFFVFSGDVKPVNVLPVDGEQFGNGEPGSTSSSW